jgi:hypothetical protein
VIASTGSRIQFTGDSHFPGSYDIANSFIQCLRHSEAFQRDRSGGRISAQGLASFMGNVRVFPRLPGPGEVSRDEFSADIEVREVLPEFD